MQAVSIAAPNFLHREIGVAMAQAGKHIWIEKPVGLTTADARAVADAVRAAGVQGAVGFNYRNAPAVAAARELIAAGELGSITHARFRLFSDYAAHPEGALSWRFERERGGSGVLGDLASHGVDLARYLLGDIDSLVADTATFLTERARPTGATSGHARATGGEMGPVENEDYVSSLVRFASGARGTLEASRVAVGEQNNYGFEIHGTKGAVFWDFRRMGELGVSVGTAYQDQAVTHRVRRARRTATTRRSSPARPAAWATTTSRSSRPTTSCGRSPRARRTAARSTTPCAARTRSTRWPSPRGPAAGCRCRADPRLVVVPKGIGRCLLRVGRSGQGGADP